MDVQSVCVESECAAETLWCSNSNTDALLFTSSASAAAAAAA